MYDILRGWYSRNFSDPQAVALVILLLIIFGLVYLIGDIMAPVLVAIILAYLLESVVRAMESWHLPRTLASLFVLAMIVSLSVIVLFGLIPVLSQQTTSILRETPGMIQNIQEQTLRLPQLYPDIFTVEQVNDLIESLRSELTSLTQSVLSFSLARLGTLVMIAVYVVLVPIMVFFALKDKHKLLAFARKFMPNRSELTFQVWREVDKKIGNYIRGKFFEILIVWAVTFALFAAMGLNYSLLLSFLVGLSVIIPYVGAIAVTVPIALIGFFQWGFTAKLGYLLLAYQVIQILDGNVLVPLLFSEVVNLHPLAIIIAVLFFGGLFGLWGVFFAIPLATLVQAVLNSWPEEREYRPQVQDQY